MTQLQKALIGTAAAAAMAVSATPALANDRYDNRDNDGISVGDVLTGALILGGIAAIATSGSRNNRYDRGNRYDDRYNRGDRYDYNRAGYRNVRQIDPRSAVDQCVRAAERQAAHHGYANVTRVRDIDRTRYGYRVRGNIQIASRGYNDRGRFTCLTDGRGRPQISYRGI